MAERLNASDSKSFIRGDPYRGFKSLLIRHFDKKDAGLQRLFLYPAETRALPAVDFAELTMVSSFYVGKCKVLGTYIHCRILGSHWER